MSADLEAWPPPEDPVVFESLCLDLWQEIWGRPGGGAQKNGRTGQPQAGVDVYGRQGGTWIGVQCKQKNGLLRSKLTVRELDEAVERAAQFKPTLGLFILATSGPRDAKIQERAREIHQDHEARGQFGVEVWSWLDIWHELFGRRGLLERIGPIYWPKLFNLFGDRKISPSRLTYVADALFGREEELARLDAAWRDPGINLVTLVAWGGVGKTSLVAKWAASLAIRDYDGADFFDWSFFSQGTRDEGAASADSFIGEALRFFGDAELAESSTSPWEKGARLAHLVSQRRTLLILDGVEPLQHPPGPLAGQLKDPGVAALLKGLAARNVGLCLVTTRESIKDLTAYRDSTAPEWTLERLPLPAGVRLLRHLRVRGQKRELEQLVEDVGGHALTLNLLGCYLAKAYGGDVRRWDRIDFQEADFNTQAGHAFQMVAAYESWLGKGGEEGTRQLGVLRLLGLFDRPADSGCLNALRRMPAIHGLTDALVGLSEEEWNRTCFSLFDCGLISIPLATTSLEKGTGPSQGPFLDTHPLVRQYFAQRLHEQQPKAWSAAHKRLYEHLRDVTEFWPNTLEGLQPLYQAVAHGCKAGIQEEACTEIYRDRILRGKRAFSTNTLGAFGADLGAVACFFEPPWSRLSPSLSDAAQAWLLNQAGFSLRALGRLTEALSPMGAVLSRDFEKQAWSEAAISANNLSELELTLGNLPSAVSNAEKAVRLADQSSDIFDRVDHRTVLADALHQLGRRTKALELFHEAERMQAEWRPDSPLLDSLRGFRYCDLLLAEAERAAWQGSAGNSNIAPMLSGVREVEKRATQAFELAQRNEDSLLSTALNQLTLGRSGFYRAILEDSAIARARSGIEQAVGGLRRAGTVEFIARGLQSRAWLRFLEGDSSGARDDLAEAEEIAESGPMPLSLADVHLHRSRLFGDAEALAAARLLIEKHDYGRRREELEDAEQARKGYGRSGAGWTRTKLTHRPGWTDRAMQSANDLARPSSSQQKRFKIGLSFAGEHRLFVEQVASCLARRLGRDRVLYDGYYEAEFARPDLDTYLLNLYHDESDLIAVFLSADYERKEWCGLEWRAVRDLIKKRQAAAVMPLRFDNTEIPGLFSIDGYAWIGDREPEKVANLIIQRLQVNDHQKKQSAK